MSGDENEKIRGETTSMTSYANTLDAADRLSLEEQEQLTATLRQRTAERRRAEFARGRTKPASAAVIAELINP